MPDLLLGSRYDVYIKDNVTVDLVDFTMNHTFWFTITFIYVTFARVSWHDAYPFSADLSSSSVLCKTFNEETICLPNEPAHVMFPTLIKSSSQWNTKIINCEEPLWTMTARYQYLEQSTVSSTDPDKVSLYACPESFAVAELDCALVEEWISPNFDRKFDWYISASENLSSSITSEWSAISTPLPTKEFSHLVLVVSPSEDKLILLHEISISCSSKSKRVKFLVHDHVEAPQPKLEPDAPDVFASSIFQIGKFSPSGSDNTTELGLGLGIGLGVPLGFLIVCGSAILLLAIIFHYKRQQLGQTESIIIDLIDQPNQVSRVDNPNFN